MSAGDAEATYCLCVLGRRSASPPPETLIRERVAVALGGGVRSPEACWLDVLVDIFGGRLLSHTAGVVAFWTRGAPSFISKCAEEEFVFFTKDGFVTCLRVLHEKETAVVRKMFLHLL